MSFELFFPPFPTGIDFKLKTITVGEKKVKLQIWLVPSIHSLSYNVHVYYMYMY